MMTYKIFSARLSGLCLIAMMSAAQSADKRVEPPPQVQELDPITVEGVRPEDGQPKKIDPEKRLKEELEKDKRAIEEIKNANGKGRVKVKGPIVTYCLDYDNNNPLTKNSVGVNLIVPVYCGPGVR